MVSVPLPMRANNMLHEKCMTCIYNVSQNAQNNYTMHSQCKIKTVEWALVTYF